jgi:hypothetical protein
MAGNFIHAITTLKKGKLTQQLDAAFAELVLAVDQRNGSGELTLKIKVSRAKGAASAQIIKSEIATKLPQFADTGDLVFPTPEGRITRDNPDQKILPGVRSIDQSVDPETGEIIAKVA